MTPLLIGISSYARDTGDPPAFSLPCAYVDGVRLGGGVPLVLPPGETDPERLLGVVDALVLAGGGDISPSVYGGQPHATLYSLSEERDRFELALARAALARPDFPLLCICRGLQILNVACGGTLHAHLPDVFGERVLHRLPPRRPGRHLVRIEAGSRVAAIVGAGEREICSWHHQAVDRLGEGLQPVAWAADGVIEGLELESHPWCLAVQWHPEMQLEDADQVRLFSALAEAARARKEISHGGSSRR